MWKLDSKYLSAIVIIVVSVLKVFGWEVGSEELSKWIESLIYVIGGIVIAWKSRKEGNLNIFGAVRK